MSCQILPKIASFTNERPTKEKLLYKGSDYEAMKADSDDRRLRWAGLSPTDLFTWDGSIEIYHILSLHDFKISG